MPFNLPTLQAFSAGQINGLWVLIGGRTNGMHGFTSNPLANFPPRKQSTRIWVIDPVSGKRWSRKLDDSSLTNDQVDMLSAFAAQEVQVGNTLYFVGGYGYSRSLGDFTTYSTMTAFDLDKIVNWVRRLGDAPGGNADLATLIRQTSNDVLKVTGGKLTMIGNRAILAFGQLFDGGYGSSSFTQIYTTQVRSFRIIDDGQTLSIAEFARFHRRQIPPNIDAATIPSYRSLTVPAAKRCRWPRRFPASSPRQTECSRSQSKSPGTDGQPWPTQLWARRSSRR
jgi:hypothetical protein